METNLVTIIGIGVGILQTVIIFLLSGIKSEIADIWQRMNNHYHEVSCANDECKKLLTGNVVIPRGQT
jgi:hypothetical protein